MVQASETKAEKKAAGREDLLDYSTLIKKVSEQQKLPEARIKAVLKAVISEIADGLESGKSVRIQGLGAFHIRNVPASEVEGKTRKAGKRVAFASSKPFNAAVKLE